MDYLFVAGKTVRRRRKTRFHDDRVSEEFVTLLISRLNEARKANGQSDVYPGVLAFGAVTARSCNQRPNA